MLNLQKHKTILKCLGLWFALPSAWFAIVGGEKEYMVQSIYHPTVYIDINNIRLLVFTTHVFLLEWKSENKEHKFKQQTFRKQEKVRKDFWRFSR